MCRSALTDDKSGYILKKSVSCQKKDGHDHVHPSFFWYDSDKDLKVCFLVTGVIYSPLSENSAQYQAKKAIFAISWFVYTGNPIRQLKSWD